MQILKYWKDLKDIKKKHYLGWKADAYWLEFHDMRASGQIVNLGTRRTNINVKGIEASERYERARLWQSVEQADQAIVHTAKGSSELWSDVRTRGNDYWDETVAQKKEASREAKVSGLRKRMKLITTYLITTFISCDLAEKKLTSRILIKHRDLFSNTLYFSLESF